MARLLTGAEGGVTAIGVTDPWTPWHIPRSIIASWWSAADHGTGLMTDDGAGLISSWSGRITGLAITAVTTARPTWSATALNGAYPGLTFDGVANCMVTTTLTTIPTGVVDSEIWGIGTTTATGVAATLCGYGQNTSGAARRLQKASTEKGQVSDGTATLVDGNSTLLTSPFVEMGSFSGTSMNGYVNANAFSTNPATITTINTPTNRLRIGANNLTSTSSFWPGVIADVIILKALSIGLTLPGRTTTLKQDLEGWAANTYGFASSLPTTHPWRFIAP